MSGVALEGAGGDGSIIEVSMGVALLGCNSAAPIGGLFMVGREVAMAIGWLRPLRRKDGGVCVADADDGGRVETFGFGRGVVTLGVGCIVGNGTFGVVVWAENISASWRSASSWGFETEVNGDAGADVGVRRSSLLLRPLLHRRTMWWAWRIGEEKLPFSCCSFCARFFCVNFVSSVMLRCITDVPSI